MKQLNTFMCLSIGNVDRISYTYTEADDSTGELISDNNKKSFVAVDATLKKHLAAIRKYIQDNKLTEEA